MGSAVPESDPLNNFITTEFLESILKTKIKYFSVKIGSNHGDNYTSVLHAIEVLLDERRPSLIEEPKERKLYLLLKAYPVNGARQHFLMETNLFLKELRIYDTLMPELIKFGEDEAKINKRILGNVIRPAIPPFVHGAAANYSKKDGNFTDNISFLHNYILMVDMRKTWNFKMADRCAGLDFAHCSLVITELAKLHALNWAYKIKKKLNALVDKFPFIKDTVFCSEQRQLISVLMNNHFGIIAQILEETFCAESEVLKGFSRFHGNPIDYMLAFIKTEEPINEEEVAKFMRIKPEIHNDGVNDPWMVGSHGDCWVNNILFRYDATTGQPEETVLLDLQLYREACPTIDLAYFLYSSTTHDIRRNHLETLLGIYAGKFPKFCKEFDVDPYPGFSFAELKRRFHRTKVYGLMTAVMILPMIVQCPDTALDLDKLEIVDTQDDKESSDHQLVKMLGEVSKGGTENTMLRNRVVGLAQELYEEGIL